MEKGEIIFSKLKPVSIFLYEDEWPEWCKQADEYFNSIGINNIYWMEGIHAEKFGVKAARPYLRDNPEQNWYLSNHTVGGYLSCYMMYVTCYSHPEWEYIFFLEEDAKFIEGWKDKLIECLNNIPDDFDILYVGSCCTEGRYSTNIAGDLYEVKYPLCGHATIISRKALKVLIEKCRDACIPMDVHLFDDVHKDLKTYTILPRLADQYDTELPI